MQNGETEKQKKRELDSLRMEYRLLKRSQKHWSEYDKFKDIPEEMWKEIEEEDNREKQRIKEIESILPEFKKDNPLHKMDGQQKFNKVMQEFQRGELKSHGKVVDVQKQAVAIAFSEARKVQPDYGNPISYTMAKSIYIDIDHGMTYEDLVETYTTVDEDILARLAVGHSNEEDLAEVWKEIETEHYEKDNPHGHTHTNHTIIDTHENHTLYYDKDGTYHIDEDDKELYHAKDTEKVAKKWEEITGKGLTCYFVYQIEYKPTEENAEKIREVQKDIADYLQSEEIGFDDGWGMDVGGDEVDRYWFIKAEKNKEIEDAIKKIIKEHKSKKIVGISSNCKLLFEIDPQIESHFSEKDYPHWTGEEIEDEYSEMIEEDLCACETDKEIIISALHHSATQSDDYELRDRMQKLADDIKDGKHIAINDKGECITQGLNIEAMSDVEISRMANEVLVNQEVISDEVKETYIINQVLYSQLEKPFVILGKVKGGIKTVTESFTREEFKNLLKYGTVEKRDIILTGFTGIPFEETAVENFEFENHDS